MGDIITVAVAMACLARWSRVSRCRLALLDLSCCVQTFSLLPRWVMQSRRSSTRKWCPRAEPDPAQGRTDWTSRQQRSANIAVYAKVLGFCRCKSLTYA